MKRDELTWVSIAAAARRLDRSTRQIRRYAEDGTIRSRRVGERGWIEVALEDVVALASDENLQPA